MAVEERKLAEDDKELPKEKLGRSDGQQTHTTNNTNISFTKEKVETKGRAKNSK